MKTPALYDHNGIPILPGDTLKIFHYTAAVRREKRYIYKWVVGVVAPGGLKPLLKISHLSLDGGFYWELMDGRTLKQCEIVQGYAGVEGGDYRDRERKAK